LSNSFCFIGNRGPVADWTIGFTGNDEYNIVNVPQCEDAVPMTLPIESQKLDVHDFWNQASCGEALYLDAPDRDGYRRQSAERYRLEPYIEPFAAFASAARSRVLEIGVGLGADHLKFAEAGADLTGIDLTKRAIEHVTRRLALFNLHSNLQTGDAERLQFADASFDVVYSWGVIHHSPDTQRAVAEIHRVLRPGGTARIMIYHKWSLVGYMLWVRYALLRLRPWLSLAKIYSRYLESPGTKAYTCEEARSMFGAFGKVDIRTVLTHGDLLESDAGQRHQGALLRLARRMWPRPLLRRMFKSHGLFMLIVAIK
jgi:SAM-dependent methyltransferase